MSTDKDPSKTVLTLQEAIDFGEYDPKYLNQFSEWQNLTIHIQWELIRKALEIRHRQLTTHYAELNNALNLSKKPAVQAAMKKLEKKLAFLAEEHERLYIDYADQL